MFAPMRASRSSILRVVRLQVVAKRTFMAPTAIRQADLVQEMYLKELKAYKPTPIKASDSEGVVQKWSAPRAPKSPEEADIANELKAYESQTVELEGQAESGVPGAVGAGEQDWFEEEVEEESGAKH